MKNSFIRFLFVGIVNTIVGLSAMYTFLHALGFSYWISTFLGNSIGAVVSFFLNKNFTFKSSVSVSGSSFRFVIVILCCYFISYDVAKNAVVTILRDNSFFSDSMKTDISILFGTGIYTILNFLGQKWFVFFKKRDTAIKRNPLKNNS